MPPAPPASPRQPSALKWGAVPLLCLLLMVLGGCAHDAASSGASSDSAGSSDASSDNSSASSDSSDASSQGSDASSASSQDSAASSQDSAASSEGTSGSSQGTSEGSGAQGTSGSEQSSGGSSEGSSRGSSEGSQGSGDPAQPSVSGEVSAVVMGSALLLSTVAGIGFAIYGTVAAVQHPRVRPDARSAALYLGAQAHQLEQDLALGAGPVLEDLGAAAGLPPEQRGRFGRLMQRHRAELLDLARRDALTPERALDFLGRVGELTWSDPLLRAEARRTLSWVEAG